MKVNGSTFFVSALLVCGLAVGFAQQLDVDRELEEAKSLYREAKFAQAIAKLQATIGRLEQLRDLQARKIQLSDAHLHLALSYVALNDPAAAKESLKQMLRADRNRRLDPDVYAPKVIELFEQARAEVAKEPAKAADAPGPASSPQAAVAKKGGSKAVPILLGIGAAAAGVVIAAGSGGAGPTAEASKPIPAPSGSNDVVFAGADPPVGSTISLANRSAATFMLRVNFAGPGRGWLFLKIADRESFMGRSTGCESSAFTPGFDAGSNIAVTHALDMARLRPACSLPVDLAELEVGLLREGTTDTANTLRTSMFTVNYRVTP